MMKFYPVILFNLLLIALPSSVQATESSHVVDKDHLPIGTATRLIAFFELPVTQGFRSSIYDEIEQNKITLSSRTEKGTTQIVYNIALRFYSTERTPEHLNLLAYTFLLTPQQHRKGLFSFFNATAYAGSGPTFVERFSNLGDLLDNLPYSPELWSETEGVKPFIDHYKTLDNFDNSMDYPRKRWE